MRKDAIEADEAEHGEHEHAEGNQALLALLECRATDTQKFDDAVEELATALTTTSARRSRPSSTRPAPTSTRPRGSGSGWRSPPRATSTWTAVRARSTTCGASSSATSGRASWSDDEQE